MWGHKEWPRQQRLFVSMHMNHSAGTKLVALVLLLTTLMSGCQKAVSRRMVAGPSIKDLVAESSDQGDGGVVQITFGQLFKEGVTEYSHIGAKGLTDSPPLPTGFVLFNGLAYRVMTEAAVSGEQVTVFSIPSAENEVSFSNLAVLHLEEDEMNPAGKSWLPVTVVPGGWDGTRFRFISKAQYDGLRPDFESRRLAAITNDFGIFAIASLPQVQAARTQPFTEMEVVPSSSPEKVGANQRVTHTIVITNKGPKPAGEVSLKEELTNLDFVSGTSTQGICKRSIKSSGRVLCYLGALPAGASLTVTVVSQVNSNIVFGIKDVDELANLLEVAFKEIPTDFVEADNQIFMQFNTT